MENPVEGLVLHTLPVPETIHKVIIYKAGCLHVGIDDGGSQELKSPLFHVFSYKI